MKTPQSNVMINQFSHVAWVDGLEKKKTFIRYTLIVFNGFFSFFYFIYL